MAPQRDTLPLELLCCPRCRGPLVDAALPSCAACGVEYPSVAGMPWLFADPAAALGEWRARVHGLLAALEGQADRYRAAIGDGGRASTRTRLKLLAAACTDHARRLRALLAPLGADRQRPLTHVSASTPEGAEPALEVRINDVRWHRVPTLDGQAPDAHVYTVAIDDEGAATLEFGDGASGARLPTGPTNVRATYRKGLGRGGMVRAGQLSLLMSRPLGLRDVTNPRAAEGGADAETAEAARETLPLGVRTLGRIVSLRDYEDFARAFTGIAKAHAAWVWDGRQCPTRLGFPDHGTQGFFGCTGMGRRTWGSL